MYILKVIMFRFIALCASVFMVAVAGQTFEEWARVNHKQYAPQVVDTRREIFYQNVEKINAHNAKGSSYSMGLNKFADLTYDEFARTYLMPNRTTTVTANVSAPYKRSIDWRINGYVQEVNDQGMCGSCWAFSAAETLSARYRFTHGGRSYVLSPQELVDCVPESYHCYGCMGGWADQAMQYALTYLHGGLEQWRDYPYVADDQRCNLSNINKTINVTGTKVVVVNKGNQTALLETLYNNGPFSICIYADDGFMLYKNGVYTSTTCPTDTTNHCVLLYGLYYDKVTTKWAYMVRNSWGAGRSDDGSGYGVDGDIFMDADVANGNLCAIASFASYIQ